ncbi:MAG: nucleoside:proton symporter [Halieaceae bacterium]|nr:nucleoside:proton symporter [Halieaceae bacterium]
MLEPITGQSLTGIVLITSLAWLSSSNRRQFNTRLVLSAIALQFVLALLFLKVTLLKDALLVLNSAVLVVEQATRAGTTMVFGFLGGGDTPFDMTKPQNSFVLAFRALPIVIVFSALSALFWHWHITQAIIAGFSLVLKKTMRIGGAVGLGSASSIFVGMVESPLIVRPYLATMSNSELFILMTCGMATVAGTVMGLYGAVLLPVMPEALSHIIVASLISAPAAIALALIMRPEDGPSTLEITAGEEKRYKGAMHAITTGTQDGLQLFLSIVAMLIVFVALVNIVNQFLGLFSVAEEALTLQAIVGFVLRPLMWSIGIPWAEVQTAGQIMANKVVLNELVAYLQLAELDAEALSGRSKIILTYALCGFANFGSLGIMLGGLTSICPERSADILKLAPLSIWSGMLATCMTGAVVAVLV